MIEQAWKRYCGWAAQARERQGNAHQWMKISLGLALLAAVCGTAADQARHWPFLHERLGGLGETVIGVVAGLAALGSALQAWLAKEKLSAENEAQWIKARAAAEAIKSECYRYAGGTGAYAPSGDAADKLFADRISALQSDAEAAGISPADGAIPAARPVPPVPMDKAFYLKNRVDDQLGYFQKDRVKSDARISQMRWLSIISMLIAAVCGGHAAFAEGSPAAGWIGVLTTIIAAITAYSFADRHKQNSIKAGMMVNRLNDLKLRAESLSLDVLVTRTEDMMVAEHALWLTMMAKTQEQDAGTRQI